MSNDRAGSVYDHALTPFYPDAGEDAFDPVLDRTLSIDHDALNADLRAPLANGELRLLADADSDLHDLFWPWTDKVYARAIIITVQDLRDDAFSPLVTRFYPGYQETIMGTEGMIVSKRLALPFHSHYDRAVIWLLGCQAEGDRLLRVDVEIDWGEALSQRMVDGLLVAQKNPQAARGLYKQQNADSTRVFGNPQARPDQLDIDDPRRAHLVYHVLVNGMVDVPLMLTVSDVGEQVAWNGFLALRDAERAFERSNKEWQRMLGAGRLWTADPRLNRRLHRGKLAILRGQHKLRTGIGATDRTTLGSAALIATLDLCDPILSRNLLANLRRIAQRTNGRLPLELPLQPRDALADPGEAVSQTIGGYVRALAVHLDHHFSAELLAAHRDAVELCAEALIFERIHGRLTSAAQRESAALALHTAATLADAGGWEVDAVRWASEAQTLADVAAVEAQTDRARQQAVEQWLKTAPAAGRERQFNAAETGEIIWTLCGLTRTHAGEFAVAPQPGEGWWALVDLPYRDEHSITLVWDGTLLHATAPVVSPLPVIVHDAIRALRTDEDEFDLTFEFVDNDEVGEPQRRLFRPVFLTEAGAP